MFKHTFNAQFFDPTTSEVFMKNLNTKRRLPVVSLALQSKKNIKNIH